MDHIEKFLWKLSPREQRRVLDALSAIISNSFEGFDIKPLSGRKNWFRCRIGKIRIVFLRAAPGTNVVYDISYRDKA